MLGVSSVGTLVRFIYVSFVQLKTELLFALSSGGTFRLINELFVTVTKNIFSVMKYET